MLTQRFQEHLSYLLGSKIENSQSVSGGDISSAYLVKTSNGRFFLKVNHKPWALEMFKVEAQGLKAIGNTNTIASPKVFAFDTFENESYLLMEYKESKRASSKDMELFGSMLAKLHMVSADAFGFEADNFIGSLHQSNKKYRFWNDFYVEERLKPQLSLSLSKGLLSTSEIPEAEFMKTCCSPYFKDIKPSLLHGDLWSGNYLISSDGNPYLIDPAVYYGHSEIDIAMSKLFGGFGAFFYDAYHKIIPKDEYTENRIELYQLYYLLVHLNLFGSSYYRSVKTILNKYFQL